MASSPSRSMRFSGPPTVRRTSSAVEPPPSRFTADTAPSHFMYWPRPKAEAPP
jgi:hypothetical protein